MKTKKVIHAYSFTIVLFLLPYLTHGQHMGTGTSAYTGGDIYYNGSSQTGIGTTTPAFKFHVVNGTDDGTYIDLQGCEPASASDSSIGILSISSRNEMNIGIVGIGKKDHASNIGGIFLGEGDRLASDTCGGNTGVWAEAKGDGDGTNEADWIFNIGVRGNAEGIEAINAGGIFESVNIGCTGQSLGVYASASGGFQIAGLYAEAFNDSSCVTDSISVSAGGKIPGVFAAYFGGNTFTTGNSYYPSDERLKRNITETLDISSQLSKLSVKQYSYNQSEYSRMHLPAGKHYGVMAQDVEKVFPHLVLDMTTPPPPNVMNKTLGESYTIKAVNYHGFIPLVIAAHNELKASLEQKNKEFERELNEMRTLIRQICEEGCDKVNKNTIQQSQTYEGILTIYPNPADQKLNINYSMKTGDAVQIELIDHSGKVHLRHAFSSLNGTHSFDVSRLSAGNYIVILKADGIVVKSESVSVSK